MSELALLRRALFPVLVSVGLASASMGQSRPPAGPSAGQSQAASSPMTFAAQGGCSTLINQPPNQVAAYFSDANCPSCPTPSTTLADDVNLTSTIIVCDLTVWGGYWPTNNPVTDIFTVIIHDQALSAVPIYSEVGVNSVRATTGATVSGVAEYVYTLTLAVPVTLAPGTYFFEIFNDTSVDGSEQWFWESGTLDGTNGNVGLAWAPSTPGAGWTLWPGSELAWVLNGNAGGNSGTPYCFGDGSGANCPCSAFGAAGQGCLNTGGAGATLTGAGNAALVFDTFSLDVVGVPGQKPGLILRGDNQVAIPAGDGILCTAGGSMRSHVQTTVAGATSFTDFNGNPFSSVANVGAPTNFQFWYRDPSNPCSGGGFNFTNGVTVTFTP